MNNLKPKTESRLSVRYIIVQILSEIIFKGISNVLKFYCTGFQNGNFHENVGQTNRQSATAA